MSTDSEREQVERELFVPDRCGMVNMRLEGNDRVYYFRHDGSRYRSEPAGMRDHEYWDALVDARLKLRAAEKALEQVENLADCNLADCWDAYSCRMPGLRQLAEAALAEIRRK